MKITFAMITFNTDFVLKHVLDSVLPFAHKVIVVEGSVDFWSSRGIKTSTDDTNDILNSYGDKITVIRGNWPEKTEMCRAFMPHVPPDTDYLWCLDSDEVFKPIDIVKIIKYLFQKQPSSLGFQSNTFFGGFDHIMTGFERNHSFKRILKYTDGCTYKTHRPPTLSFVDGFEPNRGIKGVQTYIETGVEMYHYSYVSPRQVAEKILYYKTAVINSGQCIPDYFNSVWLPWVISPENRELIEQEFDGVHEFIPQVRGNTSTEKFKGDHPLVIKKDLINLQEKFNKQLKEYL